MKKLIRFLFNFNRKTIAKWVKWDFKTNGLLEIKDKNGNLIYFEDSNGFWAKWEYDSQGKEIYYENSDGKIIDNRPKPCENKVVEIEGVKYKLVKQ
jgi:hypothetical protein